VRSAKITSIGQAIPAARATNRTEVKMDYTIVINLLWDLATGVFAGLLAYGGWLCLVHRSAVNGN
jgi:hypothetical protein